MKSKLQIAVEALEKIRRPMNLTLVNQIREKESIAKTALAKLSSMPPEEATGTKWRKGDDLPKKAGLYVCICEKKGHRKKTETVTYGHYADGFTQIVVNKKFGKVVEWLDQDA